MIESMAAHYQGKVRNAEFWLSQLINRFGQAQLVGVAEDALKAARAKHGDAHANWEWWTAANGASFHNPELRKDRSRTRSPHRRTASRSSTTRSRRSGPPNEGLGICTMAGSLALLGMAAGGHR